MPQDIPRLKGLFRLHDTHGMPLLISLGMCTQREVGVDWADFFEQAKAAGWPFDRVKKVLSEAIADSGWHQTLDEILREGWTQALVDLEYEARGESSEIIQALSC